MVSNSKYTFSLTGASALITETMIIAQEYDRLKDWKLVENALVDNNLLNKIKQSTFKREFREIKKRLQQLSTPQIKLMIQGDLEDAKAMILLALIKTYSYLRDFIIEVLRNKFNQFDKILTEADYTRFFNTKSLVHTELTEISESTSKKVKQVLFKILEQIGLITQTKNGAILKPYFNKQVLKLIATDDRALLAGFLLSDAEINALTKP